MARDNTICRRHFHHHPVLRFDTLHISQAREPVIILQKLFQLNLYILINCVNSYTWDALHPRGKASSLFTYLRPCVIQLRPDPPFINPNARHISYFRHPTQVQAAMAPSEQTINIPQLILIIVIGGFALRYFFFSNSTTASGHTSRNGASNRAREQDVETIQQMFPQVPRRSIMWDLQRNGGSVAATTERILSGRGLENVSHNCFACFPHTLHAQGHRHTRLSGYSSYLC